MKEDQIASYSLIMDEIKLQKKKYSNFGIDDISQGLDMTNDEIFKFVSIDENNFTPTQLGKKCAQILEELGKHE